MEHDNVVRKCHRYRVSEALTSEAVAHFLMLVALKMRECDLVHHHRLVSDGSFAVESVSTF